MARESRFAERDRIGCGRRRKTMLRFPNEYDTLLEVVKKSGNWVVYASIIQEQDKDGGKNIVVNVLGPALDAAIKHHDDKAARELIAWIFQAIDDAVLAPFFEEKHGMTFLVSPSEEARKRAQEAKAAKAIALWGRMPAYKEVKEYNGIRWPSPQKVVTMLDTKKAILTEIARWWRETDNGTEANQMFDFLISLKPNTAAEIKIIHDVIREATDKGFSVKRLAWCIETSTIEHLEVVRILAIAWARNADFGTLRTTLRTAMAHTK